MDYKQLYEAALAVAKNAYVPYSQFHVGAALLLPDDTIQTGINIEKVINNKMDNIVIGEVLECDDHPNSDHLHICQVNIGNGVVQQIVCGAPNVRKGLKVILAQVGAELPGDFKIKKGKLYEKYYYYRRRRWCRKSRRNAS